MTSAPFHLRRWPAWTLLAAGLLLAQAAPPRAAPGPTSAGASVGATGGAAGEATASVAVRSGDPAPVAAGFPRSYGCRLAAMAAGPAPPPAGRPFLFVDAAGSALFLKQGGEARVLAFVGQETPGGGRLAEVCEASLGQDLSIAFHAFLADGREGIYRTDASGAALEELLLTGAPFPLRDGPQTLGVLSGPALDAAGDIFIEADFLEGAGALIEIPRGTAPVVLVQSGDALAGGRFTRAPTAPAANAAGTVAFTAQLDSGREVVATLAPGGAPIVIFAGTAAPGQPPPTVAIAPPAINDAGQVAFLSAVGDAVRVQRYSGGAPASVAAGGSPAPGGGTFGEITDLEPAIDAAGRVLFGAVRSNGREGIYLAPSPTVVAESGMTLPDAGVLRRVASRQPLSAPAFLPDGAVLFGAEGTTAAGIFSWTVSGDRAVEVRAGDPLPPSVRFTSFLEASIPFMGGGPALTAAGSMIFDARVTGGGRGLFLRDRDERLTAALFDGDAAPGGGRFDGGSLAFHSLDGAGAAAFVAAAPGGPAGPGLALYYGMPRASGAASDAPPLHRVIGIGDPLPAGLALPAAAANSAAEAFTVADLQPPSRLDRGGALVLPVILSDGETVLLSYDGTSLQRLIGPGDPAPGGGTFIQIFTGSFFLGVPVPPALNDAGRVVFGGITSDGDFALFATRLGRAPGEPPVRLAGGGDEVDGGRFSPFEVQALDQDAEGRIAFSAVYDEDYDFGVFLKDGGGLAALARRFDLVGDLGFVNSVMPRLALAGSGRTAYGLRFLSGREAIVLRTQPTGTPADPEGEAATLALTGGEAPDGGYYVAFQALAEGGFRSRPTGRLASDGAGRLAWAAATSAGPEEIVLFGRPPDTPPVAEAGDDRTVECTGPDGTLVALDGGASYDADGDPLTYLWSGPFGTRTGARPEVSLPLGIWTISLVVNDGQLDSAPDTVTVTVRDTVPPLIAVAASPAILWPPDGRMVPTTIGVAVTDLCDPSPSVALIGISTFDPGGSGRRGPDYAGAGLGSDDRSIELRADRAGSGPGRTYTVTYRATDHAGNPAAASAGVAVPHDERR